MSYVDGYLLPIPKKNLQKYKKMARDAGKIWLKHGALRYMECVGDDLHKAEWCKVPFPKIAKCKPGETVIFAFVIYKTKAHRDRVNAKVTKEMKEMMEENPDADHSDMPFDVNRMAFGGFEGLVDLQQK